MSGGSSPSAAASARASSWRRLSGGCSSCGSGLRALEGRRLASWRRRPAAGGGSGPWPGRRGAALRRGAPGGAAASGAARASWVRAPAAGGAARGVGPRAGGVAAFTSSSRPSGCLHASGDCAPVAACRPSSMLPPAAFQSFPPPRLSAVGGRGAVARGRGVCAGRLPRSSARPPRLGAPGPWAPRRRAGSGSGARVRSSPPTRGVRSSPHPPASPRRPRSACSAASAVSRVHEIGTHRPSRAAAEIRRGGHGAPIRPHSCSLASTDEATTRPIHADDAGGHPVPPCSTTSRAPPPRPRVSPIEYTHPPARPPAPAAPPAAERPARPWRAVPRRHARHGARPHQPAAGPPPPQVLSAIGTTGSRAALQHPCRP